MGNFCEKNGPVKYFCSIELPAGMYVINYSHWGDFTRQCFCSLHDYQIFKHQKVCCIWYIYAVLSISILSLFNLPMECLYEEDIAVVQRRTPSVLHFTSNLLSFHFYCMDVWWGAQLFHLFLHWWVAAKGNFDVSLL